MTKQEIQQLMAIARPAIIAVYGRQRFKLVKYHDELAYQGQPLKNVWLQVASYRTIWNDKVDDWQDEILYNYKLNIENGRVTSLSVGELNV